MSYTEYDALHVIDTTGAAKLDQDGCIVESAEYSAALYESYAADHEYGEAYAAGVREPAVSASLYASTAQHLAEDLWTRDIRDVETEFYTFIHPM